MLNSRRRDEEDVEIDLDENMIATLEAQVAEYAMTVPDRERFANVQQASLEVRELATCTIMCGGTE